MRSTSPRPARIRTLGALALVLFAAATIMALFVAREAEVAAGGPLQRIFYFHVPSAWVAYLSFTVVLIGSVAYLRTGAARWDQLAHAAAELGVIFTMIVLITGPIWARPVWGTWWQWDARLTSTLVLWLTYVGYLFLRALAAEPRRVGRLAAIIGIVGFINIPIVHFSVYWWRTLHPSGPTPANLASGSGLGGTEMATFFVSLAAFTALFAWLLAKRVEVGRLAEELEAEELRAMARRHSNETSPAPSHA